MSASAYWQSAITPKRSSGLAADAGTPDAGAADAGAAEAGTATEVAATAATPAPRLRKPRRLVLPVIGDSEDSGGMDSLSTRSGKWSRAESIGAGLRSLQRGPSAELTQLDDEKLRTPTPTGSSCDTARSKCNQDQVRLHKRIGHRAGGTRTPIGGSAYHQLVTTVFELIQSARQSGFEDSATRAALTHLRSSDMSAEIPESTVAVAEILPIYRRRLRRVPADVAGLRDLVERLTAPGVDTVRLAVHSATIR